MAKISIYGTLVNDTGEPIARADQVLDPATGKMVSELLGQGATGEPLEELGEADIASIVEEIEQTAETVADVGLREC